MFDLNDHGYSLTNLLSRNQVMTPLILRAYFSETELANVVDGVRKFIRLLSLPVTPHQAVSIADEWDLTSSLELVKQAFHDDGQTQMAGHRL
jgi:hypothetical protein